MRKTLTRRASKFIAVLLATAGVGIALTACSGGTSDVTVRNSFVTQANQLCKQFTDDYDGAKAKLPIPPSNDDLILLAQATFAPDAISTYQQISALKMPKADEQDLKSLMSQAVAEVQLIQSDPIQGGSKGNQRDIVNRMRKYGLTECGAGFDHDVDHAEFLKEADGVCSTYFAKLVKVEQDQNIGPSAKEDVKLAFVVNTGLPVVEDAVNRIEAIGYAPEDKDVLTKLIADWRADLNTIAKDPSQFFVPNRPAAVDIFNRWDAFGLHSCAAPLSG